MTPLPSPPPTSCMAFTFTGWIVLSRPHDARNFCILIRRCVSAIPIAGRLLSKGVASKQRVDACKVMCNTRSARAAATTARASLRVWVLAAWPAARSRRTRGAGARWQIHAVRRTAAARTPPSASLSCRAPARARLAPQVVCRPHRHHRPRPRRHCRCHRRHQKPRRRCPPCRPPCQRLCRSGLHRCPPRRRQCLHPRRRRRRPLLQMPQARAHPPPRPMPLRTTRACSRASPPGLAWAYSPCSQSFSSSSKRSAPRMSLWRDAQGNHILIASAPGCSRQHATKMHQEHHHPLRHQKVRARLNNNISPEQTKKNKLYRP